MADLRQALGGARLLDEISARMLYSLDQGEIPETFRRYVRLPDGVVQPRTIDELRAALRAAYDRGIPIVPRGSASSGFGAVLPVRGGLVFDLSWLRRIVSVDRDRLTATVQAGVRWSDLERDLDPRGLALTCYPSNIFSTVGGWVATGGYGIGSLRYGHLSESVESLRVLLPTGEEKLLRKGDPDLPLWFGSDGQFGIVTEIALRLRPRPEFRRPILAGFDRPEEAFEFLGRVFARGVRPFHGNYWTAARMKEKNLLSKRDDFAPRPTVLLVVESEADARAVAEELRGRPEEPRWKAQLAWEDRFFPIRAKKLGPGLLAAELVFDLPDVPAYAERAEELGRRRGFEVVVEAQIVEPGRAVVIASFLYDPRDDRAHFYASAFAMKLAVAGFRCGGRPYNLGLWYSPFAERKFGRLYRRLRAYKRQVDPRGLFNPAKSFDRLKTYTLFVRTYALFNALPWWYRNTGHVEHRPPDRFDRQSSLDVCSRCAACVAHCPAVAAVGDERVSARGKLLMARWAAEGRIPPEEARLVFLCMHCKYCTEVCQSEIRLEDAFFDLERLVEERYLKVEAKISEFLRTVEERRLMEDLPMSRPEPRWVGTKIVYDEGTGQVMRVPL